MYPNIEEPNAKEETEGEELEEKKESRTNGDGIEEEVKAESDDKPELSPVAKEEKSGEEKPRETFTPKIGIKPLQLLTEPKLADVGKEDVKMKIDDLIIIPNNINHVEEGGSALSAGEKTARINVSETESTHSFLSLLVKSLYPAKSNQRREMNLSFM